MAKLMTVFDESSSQQVPVVRATQRKLCMHPLCSHARPSSIDRASISCPLPSLERRMTFKAQRGWIVTSGQRIRLVCASVGNLSRLILKHLLCNIYSPTSLSSHHSPISNCVIKPFPKAKQSAFIEFQNGDFESFRNSTRYPHLAWLIFPTFDVPKHCR